MTRDEVVQLVQRRLGYRTDLASDILLEMELAQHELTYNTVPVPWFLLSSFQINLEPGPAPWDTGVFVLNPGFISFAYPDCSIIYPDAPQFRMRSVPYPQMRDELLPRNAPKGRPQRYAQKDYHSVQIWPIADQMYRAEMLAYSGEDLIENIGPDGWVQQNKWTDLQPELLAVSTALRIAPSLRDSELTAYLTGEAARLTERMHKMTYEKQEQGFDRIINESLLTDMAPEVYP